MQRKNILLNIAFLGTCVVLAQAGAAPNSTAGEWPSSYETLEKEDKKAVHDVIGKYKSPFAPHGFPQIDSEELAADTSISPHGFPIIDDIQKPADDLQMQMERSGVLKSESMKALGISREPKPEIGTKESNLGVGYGVELALTYIELKDLQKFHKEGYPENFGKLLIPKKAFVVPLLNPKILQNPSLVQKFGIVAQSKSEAEGKVSWEISQIGPSQNFQALINARQEVLETDYKSSHSTCKCFIIWVPSMKQYFLGDQTAGVLKMKLLQDGPGHLKKGELLPARAVFIELAKEAMSGKYELPPFNPTKPRS